MGVVQERVILVVDPLVVLAVEELEIQETLEVQVPQAIQTRQVVLVVRRVCIIYFHLLEMVMTQEVEWVVVVDGRIMAQPKAISTLVAVSMGAAAVEKVDSMVAPLYMGLVVVVESHGLILPVLQMVEKEAHGDNMIMVAVANLMILLLVLL